MLQDMIDITFNSSRAINHLPEASRPPPGEYTRRQRRKQPYLSSTYSSNLRITQQ